MCKPFAFCSWVFVFFVVSCSTHRALYKKLGDDSFQGSAFLMTVDLKGKKNCSFSFLNQETKNNYLVSLNEAKQDLLVEMPEGTYRISKLQCGFSFHEAKSFFGAGVSDFTLKKNKVAYLGATKLDLRDPEKLKVEGGLKYRYSELKRVYPQLGVFSQANLTSAYTSNDINSVSFENYQERRSFNIKAVLIDSGREDLDADLSRVKSVATGCFFEEEKINPLKFGVLHLHLGYQAREFLHLTVQKNTSSYSKALRDCLESEWKKLSLKVSEKLSFDIHF